MTTPTNYVVEQNVHITVWQRSGKIAQPYFFQLQDESPFAFAGIWDEWQGDGISVITCAIITTRANELLASIHDRMPVILHPESNDLEA